MEAYEVTGSPWKLKIPQAMAVLRQYDLNRVHIVAPAPAPSDQEIRDALDSAQLPAGQTPSDVDMSVLDVRHECRSLVHRLTRPGRRAALNRLWEHLTLRQPNDDLVREYVNRLVEAGLTAD